MLEGINKNILWKEVIECTWKVIWDAFIGVLVWCRLLPSVREGSSHMIYWRTESALKDVGEVINAMTDKTAKSLILLEIELFTIHMKIGQWDRITGGGDSFR